MTREDQHALFVQAIDLLGGQRPSARALNVTDRTIRYLISGQIPLHSGFIRDMHDALVNQSAACKTVARAIDPMFMANRVEGQQ